MMLMRWSFHRQVVAAEETLAERVWSALLAPTADEAASGLADCAALLSRAGEQFQGELRLPCQLESIARQGPPAVYVGLMPAVAEHRDQQAPLDAAALLRREIGPAIRRAVSHGLVDVPRVLDALSGRPARETLAAILIGH